MRKVELDYVVADHKAGIFSQPVKCTERLIDRASVLDPGNIVTVPACDASAR